MLLDFRKPKLTILDRFLSPSGKYFCFFGLHYVKGHTCYDVGSSNKETGEVIRRHYNSDNNLAPEASAKTYWNDLKHKMQMKTSLPQEPTYLEGIRQWQDIHKKKPN